MPVFTCPTVEHDSVYSFRRLPYQGKPKCCVLSCLPFQSLQKRNPIIMDLENFSRSDIKRHLAELGYSNITEEKLDSFVRDLRKLIKYEERKNEVQHKLDEIDQPPSARQSKVPDTSTSPELEAKPRRRIRRKDRRRDEKEEVMTKHNMEEMELTRDTTDAGVLDGVGQDQDESSLYIDVDLPATASSAPTTSRGATTAQASLLEQAPSSGPGFIRVRSGPSLGRRPASSDPVALHQEYRKHWAKANIPGERRHDQLRWAVRGWMMGEEPL